ncbi:MAG: RNA methyltransferase [Ignavibacteria bacterium]|nr:RNA methyltransferase [Ignavibacteria bacterium]
MLSKRRQTRIERTLRYRQRDLTVVIENVHDPHNVSAILRSCDAVGIAEVQLVYTTEQFPKIGKKSSASAGKWVERRKFSSIADCFKTLREEGFAIYATHLGESSSSLYDLDLTKKVAIVVGNEHRGVSEEAATGADANFQIPMFGMIQSLNVSVASAVTLFEALRQRIASGKHECPTYSTQELAQLFAQWKQK